MFAALKDLMKVVSVASDYSNVLWYRVKAVTSGVCRRNMKYFLTKGYRKTGGTKVPVHFVLWPSQLALMLRSNNDYLKTQFES